MATTDGPVFVPLRMYAKIIETDPVEPPGFQHNNDTENWAMASRRAGANFFTNGDAAVGVSITGADRFPSAGGATTFTVYAVNDKAAGARFYPGTAGATYVSSQSDIRVRISLSPGLAFSSTQRAPDDTIFDPDTGFWDVGTIERTDHLDYLSLPVAVNLTADSLADLPLEERCLTAEVVRAVPWFDLHHHKRENDVTTVCLGEDPPLLLTDGEIPLFNMRDCVGRTAFPCTSADTLELLAFAARANIDLPGFERLDGPTGAVTSGVNWLQPEAFVVHVPEPRGRRGGEWTTGSTSYHTGGSIPGVGIILRYVTGSAWTRFTRAISDVSPKQRPGELTILGGARATFRMLDADTLTVRPVANLSTSFRSRPYPVYLVFSTLGTYKVQLTLGATKSGTEYAGTGTYTFHVGPAAELEVRDGGADPELSTGQRAYTVMALNNGPDTPPAAQVTLTGVPDGAEAVASAGSYAQGTCQNGLCQGVWTIGELRLRDARRNSGLLEGPTLTLITDDASAAPITAAIVNTQDYSVCLDSDGDDVDAASESACTDTSGNTWHSTAYYDHIPGNNTATIAAQAGTGAGHPDAPRSLATMATPSVNILTWQPVEAVNGHEVARYQVQRSASPWETLATDVAATKKPMYLDRTASSGSPSYRVRAVNIFGVEGPWSQPSLRRPGAPKDFAATVASSGTQIDLSWSAPADVTGVTVSGYDVEYSTDDGGTWTSLATEQSGLTYSHTGLTLTPGATWQYRARTVGTDGGEQVMSKWAAASVTVPDPKPGVPKEFTASVVSDTRANLSWSPPDAVTHVTVTGYEFGFSKDGGNTWESLTSQAVTATSFTHTHSALSAGDTRQYRARTVGEVSSGGQTVVVKGGWAFAVAMRGHATPGVPKDFTASGVSDARANLSWDAPDAVDGVTVTGYEPDFSKDGGNTWTRLTGTQTQSGTTYTLPHTDDTLAAGAVRQYRVLAVGTVSVGGETVTVRSGWAFAAATRDYPTPGAPRNFVARAISQSQVDLSWSAPEAVTGVSVTGYDIEFSTDGFTWNSLAQGRTETKFPHTDNTLAAGVIRQYRVRAVGEDANNAVFRSGWVFASAATEDVGAPQNLAADADGRNRIDLSWDQPAFGADLVAGYRIDYTLASPEQWETLEHGHGGRRYEHAGLSPGQEYCYRVAAVYAGGTGPFADRACATTEGAPTDLPGEPENLRVTRVGSNYVVLEWDPPGVGGAVEYYEYRYDNREAAVVTPRTATSVTVRGLAPGQTYEFQVRAGNSYGTGQWSRPVLATLDRPGGTVKASPMELEVEKGGSGSFNVRLDRSPQWPLMVYFHSIGPECLTRGLTYQQGMILLPGNLRPSKEFWEDGWWGPPEDRWARPYYEGLDVRMDASGCQGGETTVVQPMFSSLPFSQLVGLPLWDQLGLNQEEWRGKWGVDPMDGVTGPGVKVTVADGAVQSNPGAAGQPTAVTLDLDPAMVSESAGEVTVTATLDAPAPDGGVSFRLVPGPDDTAARDADYTMPDSIAVAAGERSGTGVIAVVDDHLDELGEAAYIVAFAALDYADLTGKAVLTIEDDDTAGVTVSAANPLAVNEGGTATYTLVLDSQPTADVTITATSGDAGAAAVSPASHTFTPSGWDTPLTFTVSGVADTDTSDETVAISHGVSSADAKYAVLPVATVPVAVTDTTPPG